MPECACFVDGSSNNRLSDLDCGAPFLNANNSGLPNFAIESLAPNVGPITGATILTLMGLGIDRALSRFNFIDINQIDAAVSGQNSSFYCVMEMCQSSTTCRNMTGSPVVWNTTVAVQYTAQDEGDLTLQVGDEVTVYGCSPCAYTDPSGNYYPGKLVASLGGIVGFAPADLQMYAGETRDRVYCVSPSSSSIGNAQLFIVGQSMPTIGSAFLTGNFIMKNSGGGFSFQYYSYEQLVRVEPDYAPLRFDGGSRGPSDIDQPITVTVTGVNFVSSSYYSCMFYDKSDLDNQCISPAILVDAGTLICQMPVMRRGVELQLQVSANSQQFSPSFVMFWVYQVESIDPVCSPWTGSAIVTVFGDYLVRLSNPQDKVAVCRFGRVSATTGATSDADLTVWFAYHSIATPSIVSPGALECPAPPVYLELHDFSLSLDSCECGSYGCPTCLFSWTPPLGGQNYYYGSWDSAQGPLQVLSELPPVFFITIQAPTVFSIYPSIGPLSGMTKVTVSGSNFSTSICPWGYNQFPSCSFGFVSSTVISFVDPQTVICTSPASNDILESKLTLEVAVDGQTYTNNGVVFEYVLPFPTDLVLPSLGELEGGSSLEVMAPVNVDLFTQQVAGMERFGRSTENLGLGLFKNTPSLACVFVSEQGLFSSILTPATFLSDRLLSCVSPSSPVKVPVWLYVTPSNESDPSQLSYGNTSFAYYIDPLLSELMDNHGPVEGGTLITVIGENFQSSSSLKCKFNYTSVPATFVDLKTVLCYIPKSSDVGIVRVRISLNGMDFSQSYLNFYYYQVVDLFPSIGPIQGGNSLTVTVNTNGAFSLYSTQSSLKLGEVQDFFSGINGNTIIFQNIPEAYVEGRVSVSLSLQSNSNPMNANYALVPLAYEFYSLQVNGISPLPITYSDDQNSIGIYINVALSPSYPITCKLVKNVSAGYNADKNAIFVNATMDASGSKIYFTIPTTPSAQSSVFFGWNISISLNSVDWIEAGYIPLFSQPSVRSVDPSTGARQGGTIITVRGEGFRSQGLVSCSFSPFLGEAFGERIWVTASLITSTQVLCASPSSSSTSTSLLPFGVDISLNGRDLGVQADGLPLGSRHLFLYYSFAEPEILYIANRTGTAVPFEILLYGLNLDFNGPPNPTYWARLSYPPYCDSRLEACWASTQWLSKSNIDSNSEVTIPVVLLPTTTGPSVLLGVEYSLNGGNSTILSPQAYTYFSTTPSCQRDIVDCGVGLCGPSGTCECLTTSDNGASYEFSVNPASDMLSDFPPYSASPFSAGLICDAGPRILSIQPNSGLISGGTALILAAAYFADSVACGIWCRLSAYRLACVFNVTYFDGEWRSSLILSNVSMQNTDGYWVPWGLSSPIQSSELVSSQTCSLPASDPRYSCLSCKTPSLMPFLNRAARNVTVTMDITYATKAFFDCSNGLASCDQNQTIFRFRDDNIDNSLPLIAGFSDPQRHSYNYYRAPSISSIIPLSAPVNTNITFFIEIQQSDDSFSGSIKEIFLNGYARCRLDMCRVRGCSQSGAACSCVQIFSAQEGSFGVLTYISESSLSCQISSQTIPISGLYVLSVSFNGQDWIPAAFSNAVLFYKNIVLVNHTVSGQRLSFGVEPDLVVLEEGNYPRLAPSSGGTKLVGYYQQTCNTSVDSDVNCAMLLSANCSGDYEFCEGRAAFPTLRFVPGRCTGVPECSCAAPGSRDTAVLYDGPVEGFYLKFSAIAPPPSSPQVAGVHHVCFSLDGGFFQPMILVQNSAEPSSIVHFDFYNISLDGLSVSQGPNSGKLQITVFGRGFPSASVLQEFSSDTAVKMKFIGGQLSNGNEAVIEGFSQCETSSGFIACQQDMTSLIFISESEIAVKIPRIQYDGSAVRDIVELSLSLNGLDFSLPSPQTAFQSFQLPNILGWSPLYGLFEEELTLSIAGINFTDLGASVCRFPTIYCYDDLGQIQDPCIVPAQFISTSEMQCVMPGIRRTDLNGEVAVSTVSMEFSPLATEFLKDNYKEIYDELFIMSDRDFTFHLPFDEATLSAHASPVNIAGTMHKLVIDSTKQMVRLQPGGPLQCLSFEKIHRDGSLKLALRNVGSSISNTFTPVNITKVEDTIDGCQQLGGFCRTDSCQPVVHARNPPCCSAANTDPLTCCPRSSSNASVTCWTPNIINIDPSIAVGALTQICTAVIFWSPPAIFLCKTGLKDGEPCNGDPNECPGGVCVQTPMLADLRISTNSGQQFASPVGAQIIFYSPSTVQSVFPLRVMKDCGSTDCWMDLESSAGARAADQTTCGRTSACEARETVTVSVYCPMDLAQMCTYCRVISQGEAQFGFKKASCRFTSKLNTSLKVVVPGTYTYNLDYPTVSCIAPVFTFPCPVDVEVALDGFTFVGAQTVESNGVILFIARPSVNSVLPTNGVFGAETSFTVHGDQFCNETAGTPCGVNSTFDWCIYDFKSLTTTSENWDVQRRYTTAFVKNPNQLICKAPIFTPDTVPARPEALVGFMPNLRFNSDNVPTNIQSQFLSSAFVIFHSRPIIFQIMPSTGPSYVPSTVSIQTSGIFSAFPGCVEVLANSGETVQTDLNIGNDPSTACSLAIMPPPLLYCLFDQTLVPATISLKIPSSTSINQVETMTCNSPNGSSFSQTTVAVKVGLNPFSAEFSNFIDFLYVDVSVWGAFPNFGVDVNEDFINIIGSNFQNVTQLTCFFIPVVPNVYGGSIASRILERKAIYIDSNDVKCTLPMASEYPLMCSCRCLNTPCTDDVISTNLASYTTDGSPLYSEKIITSTVCKCCNEASLGNTTCAVKVAVGSNIQNMAVMPSPIYFQYDVTAPQVLPCCVESACVCSQSYYLSR